MTSQRESHEIPSIPELEGDYEIVRELGRGGTAVVYLARERELGRDVAIKLIRPAYVKDEDAIARLVREARTVGKLQHPNIVMLLGTRRLGDQGLALILQYVPGRTLKDRIREEGPLTFEETERILRDLGRALAYAHRHRIVHRDIKPENVYLDDGCELARLADFGIARAWDSDSGLTLPGTAIGTPSYMSPEQVDGKDLDGRSDLYSLGLVGYEMLTAQQPWAGESLYSVIYKQKHEDLPDLAGFRPDVPDNLRRAIDGALAKQPGDRWRNAEAFLAALSEGSSLADDGERFAFESAVLPSLDSPWSPDFGVAGGGVPSFESGEGETPGSESAPVRATAAGTAVRPADRWRSRAAQPESYEPYRKGSRTSGDGRGLLRTGTAVVVLAGLVLAGVFLLGPEGAARSLFDSLNPLGPGPVEPVAWEESGGAESTGESAGTEQTAAVGGLPSPPDSEAPSEAPPSSRLPTAVSVIRGSEQSGRPGAILPEPIVLQVLDSLGQAVGDVPVLFEVVSGGGSAEPEDAVTAADGTVRTRWTLGDGAGEQLLQARLPGIDGVEAALFRARARDAFPARAEVLAGGQQEAEPGRSLAEPIEIRLVDGTGSPLVGATVRFRPGAGAGTVDPAVTTTDQRGIARARWTLGTQSGSQELHAEADGVSGAEVRITATARATRIAVRAGVVAGGMHTCSLRSNGTTVCWGANDQGQLGDGSMSRRLVPAASVEGGPFARMASGLSHSCALDETGQAFCWGANDQGQLGDGSGGRRASPGAVTGNLRFGTIAAGGSHTCAVTPGGATYCWGGNDAGQLGDAGSANRTSPARVRSDVAFREVVAGWRHTCALDGAGRAHCWGANDSGQLGSGTGAASRVPRAIPGGSRFVALGAGNAHTCGVDGDGRVLCWGDNEHGQLGDGTRSSRATPTRAQSEASFRSVAAGALHTCALTENGTALCWGRNLYGQLGDGTTQDRSTPAPVSGNHRFAELQAFGSHTCGRTASGEVLCWGYNLEGQLGDGSRENRPVPTPVSSARP